MRELQKWIEDGGVYINWFIPNDNYERQPIINLLRQRIAANEHRAQQGSTNQGLVDLADYFEPKLCGFPFYSFLLFETWGRPRDLVRLLSTAAKYVPRSARFASDHFIKSQKEYSRSCWEEKKDELNTKYSQTEIEAIRRTFSAFKTPFSLRELEAHISFLSSNDPRLNQFYSGRNLLVVLEDLFKVGILGNLMKTKKGGTNRSFCTQGFTT